MVYLCGHAMMLARAVSRSARGILHTQPPVGTGYDRKDRPLFDNPSIRGLFSSLSDDWVYLNSQASPQIPEKVSAAVARSFRVAREALPVEVGQGSHSASVPLGTRFGQAHAQAARVAVADLVGGAAECVVLGPNRAMLIERLSQNLARRLRWGAEVVVSRADDPANIRPWVAAADLFGAGLRWAEPDVATGVLPAWQFSTLVGEQTAVVAVCAANAFVGAVNDVAAIGSVVRARSSALFVVDANSTLPYRPLQLRECKADVMALDIAALGGPEVGALVFKDRATLERAGFAAQGISQGSNVALHVSEGLLGGVVEAVDFMANLAQGVAGSRRKRLLASVPQAAAYMEGLAARAVEDLQGLGNVHVIGIDGELGGANTFDAIDRVPRIAFFVESVPASVVRARLLSQGVVIEEVDASQSPLLEAMGAFDGDEGVLVVGFAPHNTVTDVDQLIRAVASLR